MAVQGKKTLKEKWKEQISFMAGRKGYITIRQLALVLGVHRNTIANDIITGKIQDVLKKGGENSKSPVFIPVDSANKYIDEEFHHFDEAPQKEKSNPTKGNVTQLFTASKPGKEKKPVQLSLFGNM